MTQQNSNNNQNRIDDDEIDLIALAKTLWGGRKKVIKTTLIFMIIGLFVAIFSEKEYTASTTFVPQASKGMNIGGNLSGLAAMAGINLDGTSSDSGISPTLYPQILNSVPFQKELLQIPLTIEGLEQKITLEEYYNNIYRPGLFGYLKKYTIGLPAIIISFLKGESDDTLLNLDEESMLFSISEEESKLIEKLSEQILLDVNDDDGYVTISTKMPEALSSAELTFKVEELLQKYVINFKIKKSNDQLNFIKERFLEVEKKYKKAQIRLSNHRDRNLNINTAMGNSSLELLQDEYDLVYGVYKELAMQLESQYIQVTEDTPVFTVLKPVIVPNEKSKPLRLLIIIIWTFLGFIFGVILTLGKNIYSSWKEKWVEIQ